MKKILFTLMTVLMATLAAQAATKYEINVGGVEVTSDNASYITGKDIKDGYGVYNASTNTLSLYSIKIRRASNADEYGILNRKCDNLTIVFYGYCEISCSDNALKLERSTILNAASGSYTYFCSAARVCANLKSYSYSIRGSGEFCFVATATGYEAIKGDGTGSTTLYFQGAQVTASAGQRSALSSFTAYFDGGTDVTIKANGSNASVSNVAMHFLWETTILSPIGAYYYNNTIFNTWGQQITSQDIYISDNYALLLNSTNFPDANFRSAMLSLYPKGYLTTYELNNLTTLNVASKNISDMKGIEKLTALKTLYCYSNKFTALNLNSNTALTYLDCAPNTSLTSLSISNCTNLETLICYQTGITSLALDNLSKLKTLKCYSSQLGLLTVTGKSQLTTVDCSYCPSLRKASIYNNSALTTLDARGCTAMTSLTCWSNKLSTLNVTGNTAMTYLDCNSNTSLTTITGLADCTALKTIYCGITGITDLSAVNNFSNLEYLSCYNTKISSLSLNNKSKLTNVYCNNNPNLTTAEIYNNSALWSLDISNCKALSTLKCFGNNLSSLNVQGCSAMTTLWCNNNKLTSLTVQGCTALNNLACYWNQIKAASMTTLVNSLPMRSNSNQGTLAVLYKTSSEGNVFNASHLSAAKAKYWNSQEFNGYRWVDITFDIRGDVNGDGEVSIADINALVNIILGGSADSETRKRADVNEDGEISVADINVLVGLILEQ